MTAKRKPGRPDTHLTDRPTCIRMTVMMWAQIQQAAEKRDMSISAWWREAVEKQLEAESR